MSFNRLPTETVQLIIDRCYQADQAYKIRTGLRGGGSINSSGRAWYGRSCSAISLVSKGLRAMSVQYVFKTATITQLNKTLFKTWILGSRLARNVTTVDFDTYNTSSITFALFHVLPHLPRLESIEGLDMKMVRALFGAGGMSRVSKGKFGLYAHDLTEAQLLAWNKFKAIAKRIQSWELELEAQEVETLFSIDPTIKSKIRHLSLSTPENEGFAILESEESRFPALLSSLPSLTSLSVSKAAFLASTEEHWEPLSELAISTTYQFAASLTSFTYLASSDFQNIDLPFLHFLTQFSSLRHLRIQDDGFRGLLQEPEPFEIPNLRYLELITSRPGQLDEILHLFSLPRLVKLTLDYAEVDREDLLDWKTHLVEDLSCRLNLFDTTLRHIHFVSTEGFYRRSVKEITEADSSFKKLKPRFYTSWQPGEPEAQVTDPSFDVYRITVKISKSELIEGMVEGVENLKSWVGEEVTRAQEMGDIHKVKEVMRALKPIWELKEWSKD
ncbi:hypothetical protein JCM5350_008001 [Sporobolomyces pararoseus]